MPDDAPTDPVDDFAPVRYKHFGTAPSRFQQKAMRTGSFALILLLFLLSGLAYSCTTYRYDRQVDIHRINAEACAAAQSPSQCLIEIGAVDG